MVQLDFRKDDECPTPDNSQYQRFGKECENNEFSRAECPAAGTWGAPEQSLWADGCLVATDHTFPPWIHPIHF